MSLFLLNRGRPHMARSKEVVSTGLLAEGQGGAASGEDAGGSSDKARVVTGNRQARRNEKGSQ
ncbi:MAG: hypothetical protein V7739_11835 [Motiliproteus sp.]